MNEKQIIEEGLVHHIPYIRRVVGRLSKRDDVVDDISQEVCVRIIEKEKLWNKNISQLHTWMNAITRNVTINCLSKKTVTILPISESLLAIEEKETFSEDQIQWVLEQFALLSQKKQRILRMRYFQDMKVTEIATQLGLAHSTVSHHIESSLNVFRKKLKNQKLLLFLMPWNWDINFLTKVSLMSSSKKISIALIVLVTGSLGGFVYSRSFSEGAVLDDDIKVIVPSFNTSTQPSIPVGELDSQAGDQVVAVSNEPVNTMDVNHNPDLVVVLEGLKKLGKENSSGHSEEDFEGWEVEDLLDARELQMTCWKVTDADMDYIKKLSFITELFVGGTEITDEGIKGLSSMTSLKKLSLGETNITDEGLRELSAMTSLESLSLAFNRRISGTGLRELSSLSALKLLNLSYSDITNEDLRELRPLLSLEKLYLNSSNVDSEGLDELLHMTYLTSLGLGETNITDEGLKKIATLKSLSYLGLENTNITDGGFEELASMKSLRHLSLWGTWMSEEKIEQLKKILPDCKIKDSEYN